MKFKKGDMVRAKCSCCKGSEGVITRIVNYKDVYSGYRHSYYVNFTKITNPRGKIWMTLPYEGDMLELIIPTLTTQDVL